MGKPTIRFEGYTDDWEQRKLGELVGIYDGVHQTPDYQDSGIMFLSVENIATLKSEKYISEEAFERDYKVYPEKSDILMTRIGDVGTTNVVETAEKVAFYVSLALLKPNGIDSYFLSNAMKTNAFQKGLRERTLVTAIPQKINKDEIGKIDIFITNNDEEQKKIGAYFSNLDHLITLHHRKCEETKKLKKFMLQKMFPKKGEKVPDIRFDGFTDDWEQRKLGEVCEIKDSARIPNSEWSETGVPYIRASDVTNENTDGVLFISQERYEFYKNRTGVPTKDDVLFNGGGEIGKSLLITDKKPIYVQGGAVLYARTSKSRELVGQYLKTYFETTNAKSYVDTASAGGTMRHFTLKPSQMMRILMPSVEEQEKIGEYFANLDHLITLHQHKCEELQNIKKFMLQNMFT